jgi:hypothetical protein
MPQVQVRCTVDNCYFWTNDNFCNAESILITSDQAAEKFSGSFENQTTASLVGRIGETPAQDSRDTACHTFQQR